MEEVKQAKKTQSLHDINKSRSAEKVQSPLGKIPSVPDLLGPRKSLCALVNSDGSKINFCVQKTSEGELNFELPEGLEIQENVRKSLEKIELPDNTDSPCQQFLSPESVAEYCKNEAKAEGMPKLDRKVSFENMSKPSKLPVRQSKHNIPKLETSQVGNAKEKNNKDIEERIKSMLQFPASKSMLYIQKRCASSLDGRTKIQKASVTPKKQEMRSNTFIVESQPNDDHAVEEPLVPTESVMENENNNGNKNVEFKCKPKKTVYRSKTIMSFCTRKNDDSTTHNPFIRFDEPKIDEDEKKSVDEVLNETNNTIKNNIELPLKDGTNAITSCKKLSKLNSKESLNTNKSENVTDKSVDETMSKSESDQVKPCKRLSQVNSKESLNTNKNCDDITQKSTHSSTSTDSQKREIPCKKLRNPVKHEADVAKKGTPSKVELTLNEIFMPVKVVKPEKPKKPMQLDDLLELIEVEEYSPLKRSSSFERICQESIRKPVTLNIQKVVRRKPIYKPPIVVKTAPKLKPPKLEEPKVQEKDSQTEPSLWTKFLCWIADQIGLVIYRVDPSTENM